MAEELVITCSCKHNNNRHNFSCKHSNKLSYKHNSNFSCKRNSKRSNCHHILSQELTHSITCKGK